MQFKEIHNNSILILMSNLNILIELKFIKKKYVTHTCILLVIHYLNPLSYNCGNPTKYKKVLNLKNPKISLHQEVK